MTTEMLVGIQVLIVLVLGIGMLLLLLLRQRKTIAELQAILTQFRDDMSGDSVLRYLAEEIELTTGHSSQNAVDLNMEVKPEEFAVGLRFHALRAEQALLQVRVEAGADSEIPWRNEIKHYEGHAGTIYEQMRMRVDHTKKLLNDVHTSELDSKDKTIADLTAVRNDQKQQLQNLKPLQDFISSATAGAQSTQALEQLLHRALLGLCENFAGSEKMRELVFLMHESFNEVAFANQQSEGAEPAPVSERKTMSIDPAQNLDMLNNIIARQNETIRNLRKQIDSLTNEMEKQGLLDAVSAMEQTIDSTRQCVENLDLALDQALDQSLQRPAPEQDDLNTAQLIEQFTTESAVMVEKIYLLSNLNKQLTLENDQLRAALENTAEQDQPLMAGMKLKLEKQKNEMIALQQSFKELEEKYLQLYREGGAR